MWRTRGDWRETCEAFEADGVTFLSSKYLTKLLQQTNIYVHFVKKVKIMG
jgi:hypothetical protein